MCGASPSERTSSKSAVVSLAFSAAKMSNRSAPFLPTGKEMAIRVAADDRDDVAQVLCGVSKGIGCLHRPNGNIEWISSPGDMDAPLAQIVAGTFDSDKDLIRLKVEQEVQRRQLLAQERERLGRQEYKRINGLVIAGKLDSALAETEKALAAFRDTPKATNLFRMMHVHVLANLPGRSEEAFRLATELAVEAKMDGRREATSITVNTLLNAAECPATGARDKRLIDLSLELLRDPDGDWGDGSFRQELVGLAYHLRADSTRAKSAILDAIAKVRELKPPIGADGALFADETRQRLNILEKKLKEYSVDTPPTPADRR